MTSHSEDTLQVQPAATRPRPRRALALMLVAGIGCAVVGMIDPCGWHRADAQAPVGHRQPTPAEVGKADPTAKKTAVNPADQAMERALNNICRGCSPMVPVGNVPRYDVTAQCRATATAGRDEASCRRDEETARNQLNTQWTQFTAAGRSNCIQTAAIGGKPSYVELFICLKATSIAPNLPDAR